MSAVTMIAAMLIAFALSTILGCVIAVLMFEGYNYTAALITIAYLVGGLGMVIYALA